MASWDPSVESSEAVEDDNELAFLNFFNAFLFLANAFVTVALGLFGAFEYPTVREVSDEYPTLITPAFWTASIVWPFLIGAQFAWAVIQLLPTFRNAPLVRDGVRHYYVGVCLCQIVWVMTFAYRLTFIALFAAMAILIFLLFIVHEQDKIGNEYCREYWLLKFPFVLYIGWILAVVLWNASLVMVDLEVNKRSQYIVAIASLVAMGVAALLALCTRKSSYMFSLVLSFVLFGISTQLKNPPQQIVDNFFPEEISAVEATAVVVNIVIWAIGLLRGFLHLIFLWRCTREWQGPQPDDETTSVGWST